MLSGEEMKDGEVRCAGIGQSEVETLVRSTCDTDIELAGSSLSDLGRYEFELAPLKLRPYGAIQICLLLLLLLLGLTATIQIADKRL